MDTDAPPSATVRIITIYPLAAADTHGREGTAKTWRPVTSDSVRIATDVVPASAAAGLEVVARVASINGRATALVLDVRGVADDFASVVSIAKDLFDPDVPLAPGGRPILDHLDAGGEFHPPAVSYPHQIVVLPDANATLHDTPGVTAESEGRLRQLLFKDTDIAYDTRYASVSRPADLSAALPSIVHVWDSMTVVEGLEAVRDAAFLERRVADLVDVNVQVLAARVAAVQIKDGVLELVDGGGADAPAAPALPEQLTLLRAFRQRLIRDVGMLLSPLVVTGGRPIVSYHATLVQETGITASAAATEDILGDLLSVAEIDRNHVVLLDNVAQTRQQTELLSTSKAIRTLGVVFATVSGILAVAGLVAALAAVPAEESATWSDGLGRSVVLGGGVALAALFLGLGFAHALGVVKDRRIQAMASSLAAVSAVVAVAFAVQIWTRAPNLPSLAVMVAFFLSVATTGTGIAYSVNYVDNQRSAAVSS